MGVALNVHTGGGAPEKALAERIAVLRTRSLAKILEAAAFLMRPDSTIGNQNTWQIPMTASRLQLRLRVGPLISWHVPETVY